MNFPKKITRNDFLKKLKENHCFELKKAAGTLPKEVWETVSSFSNTMSGTIYLGVEERINENNIVGVTNPQKIISDFWNTISNPEKISYRTVNNSDVQLYDVEGKCVIEIHVPEAPNSKKPIFLKNRLENSYIRTGDGDRKMTLEELKANLRNAQSISDSIPINKFTINDLDEASITRFKTIVSNRYPEKDYDKMSDEAFLVKIGAAIIDRDSGVFKIYRGTLLFLGKYNSIRELYPHYHLDYFNYCNSSSRWNDRVASDEPADKEMNIMNFFFTVFDKLKNLQTKPFMLDTDLIRKPQHDINEGIREALVNCLVHADYELTSPCILITATNSYCTFTNPGKMLISKEQFIQGGKSVQRNEIIMKMFRLIGAAERQGFGGPQIFRTAIENRVLMPEVETNIHQTEVKIWYIDIIQSHPELTNDERLVATTLLKSVGVMSFQEIREQVNLTDYYIRKALDTLMEKKIVIRHGKTRSSRYSLSPSTPEFVTQLQDLTDATIRMVLELQKKINDSERND